LGWGGCAHAASSDAAFFFQLALSLAVITAGSLRRERKTRHPGRFGLPKTHACHPIAKDSFTGGVMAIIHYGKSVFVGNARTRRHRRRQPLSRLKLSIDQALGCEPENPPLRHAERIAKRSATSRVERAIAPTQVNRSETASFDNCCLPHVHLYAVR